MKIRSLEALDQSRFNVERINILLSQTFYLREESRISRGEFAFISASFQDLKEQARFFLHPQEIIDFSNLSSEKNQENYLLGRCAAKAAVSHFESDKDISLTDMRIESGIFYHPILYSPSQEKVQVSLSHCDGRAVALAFSESHPMGIDLEVIDQKANSAIDMHLTSYEKQLLMTLNNPGSHTLFWTLKEALSKVLRTGLLSPLKIYELKNIDKHDNVCWFSHFRNFPQYQGFSFSLECLICSIVYPKQVILDFDVFTLFQKMRRQGFLREIIDP